MTLDRIAWFIGEIARPFAIIWTALCAGVVAVVLGLQITDPVQAVFYIGTVYGTGVAPLFIGKAVEVASGKKQSAQVEIAKSKEPS